MNVLVTGATGFLGSQICKFLLENGHDVIAIKRKDSDPWRCNLFANGKIQWIEIDLAYVDQIESVIAKICPETIIHCAAYGVFYGQKDTTQSIQINVISTVMLVELAAKLGVKKFIHIGSSYEYGENFGPIDEDALIHPSGLYGASKACGSILAAERGLSLGLPLIVLRPFGIYGQFENSKKLVPLLFNSLMYQKPIFLTPGEQIRDYVFVEDVAKAVIKAIGVENKRILELNICSGKPIKIKELGKQIAEVCEADFSLLKWGKRKYRVGEFMEIVGNPRKTKKILNWEATTSLTEGLHRTFELNEKIKRYRE